MISRRLANVILFMQKQKAHRCLQSLKFQIRPTTTRWLKTTHRSVLLVFLSNTQWKEMKCAWTWQNNKTIIMIDVNEILYTQESLVSRCKALVSYDKPQSALRDPTLQPSLSNSRTTQLLPSTPNQVPPWPYCCCCWTAPEISVRYRQQPIKQNNNVKCLNGTLAYRKPQRRLKRWNTERCNATSQPHYLKRSFMACGSCYVISICPSAG